MLAFHFKMFKKAKFIITKIVLFGKEWAYTLYNVTQWELVLRNVL